MREIKFRGVTPKGEVVFGDLTHDGENVFVGDSRVVSYSQLCGHDMSDDEVYEGDTVIAHGKEYSVKLVPNYGLFKNLKSCILKP